MKIALKEGDTIISTPIPTDDVMVRPKSRPDYKTNGLVVGINEGDGVIIMTGKENAVKHDPEEKKIDIEVSTNLDQKIENASDEENENATENVQDRPTGILMNAPSESTDAEEEESSSDETSEDSSDAVETSEDGVDEASEDTSTSDESTEDSSDETSEDSSDATETDVPNAEGQKVEEEVPVETKEGEEGSPPFLSNIRRFRYAE